MLPAEALKRALTGVAIPNEEWLERVSDEAVTAAKRYNPTNAELGQTMAFGNMQRTPAINVSVVLAHALLDLPGNAFAKAGYSDGCVRMASQFLTFAEEAVAAEAERDVISIREGVAAGARIYKRP